MAEHEFKKGDRVVFVKDDYCGGVEMPKGTLATYDDDDYHALPWVRLDTGERVITWHDRIAPAEPDTPAPLDPAKVKAGDTVTLESVLEAPFKVTGVVEKIDITLFDADGLVAAFNVMIWSRWFTVGINLRLTDHQPAPEPEEVMPIHTDLP